jgi:hypothetical protein
MHTANSVIITIKLIHHRIISGRLVSVVNSHVPLHVLITISVLDPRISYDALQEDFADDSEHLFYVPFIQNIAGVLLTRLHRTTAVGTRFKPAPSRLAMSVK